MNVADTRDQVNSRSRHMSGKWVRVWDPLVRLFHWSLVATFIIAWLSGEEEGLLHVYAGYAVMGLVVFRILWGFIGTRHARFSSFLYSPQRMLRYLGSLFSSVPEHYTGHNPAGGWMIILLLASLLISGYTGLEAYGAEGHGPLAGNSSTIQWVSVAHADSDDDHDGHAEHHAEGEEEFWEEVHEFFANFTLLLVFLHLLGVIVASRAHGENLVRAMVTGDKQLP